MSRVNAKRHAERRITVHDKVIPRLQKATLFLGQVVGSRFHGSLIDDGLPVVCSFRN